MNEILNEKNNNDLISEELTRKSAHYEAVKSTLNMIPSEKLSSSYTKFEEAKDVSIVILKPDSG